jgi:hypothetical protein
MAKIGNDHVASWGGDPSPRPSWFRAGGYASYALFAHQGQLVPVRILENTIHTSWSGMHAMRWGWF